MAKKNKNWLVVEYTSEKLCAAVFCDEINLKVAGVKKVSEHDTYQAANKAAGAHAAKKKITHQQ